MSWREFLEIEQYSLPQREKESLLLSELNRLTRHHRQHCALYEKILAVVGQGENDPDRLSEVPWLPVSLFKTHEIRSIPASAVHATLTSSGTTNQIVSRIFLDGETADRQARALASVISHVAGKRRLPMLIVDCKEVMRDPKLLSARGAGVLGMMRFGRNHCFVLDEEMNLDMSAVEEFFNTHRSEDILVFGFTFMIWKHFYQALESRRVDLSRGILIHSGGWKKLQDQAVDNEVFKNCLSERTGLTRIYSFYGMVEQIGSIFLEGEDGFLYPPIFSDVIIRDPDTWDEAPPGEVGVVQVLSVIPRSYPGHSLMSEDLGVIEHVDRPESCGRWGKAIRIIGRVPKVELRGCSDVYASAEAPA